MEVSGQLHAPVALPSIEAALSHPFESNRGESQNWSRRGGAEKISIIVPRREWNYGRPALYIYVYTSNSDTFKKYLIYYFLLLKLYVTFITLSLLSAKNKI
jgi:hypothetical protein